MIVLPYQQGSEEWLAARQGIPTASEFAPFMIEQLKCRLTKAELQDILTECGIEFKKAATNDELIKLLPDVTPHLSLTETAAAAREEYLSELLTAPLERDEFEQEAEDRLRRKLDSDPWIQRGKILEPIARKRLASKLGREIAEVGLILHDSREFGASPDGMILSEDGNSYDAGVEIKCHNRKRHVADRLKGALPKDHVYQCHGGMIVTGLKRWHYYGFHPALPSLHVVVEWNDFTDELLAGMLALAEEKKALQKKLADMWEAEFSNQH